MDDSSNQRHNGTYLAKLHDIVVITANYRLGLFGFLGGEQLRYRNDDNSTGNYAIADCILALTWAKQVSHAC